MDFLDPIFLEKFSHYLSTRLILPHTDIRYAHRTFAYMFNAKYDDTVIVHRVENNPRLGFSTPIIPCSYRDDAYRFVFIAHSEFNRYSSITSSQIRPLIKPESWYRDINPYRIIDVAEGLLSRVQEITLPNTNVSLMSAYREKRSNYG